MSLTEITLDTPGTFEVSTSSGSKSLVSTIEQTLQRLVDVPEGDKVPAIGGDDSSYGEYRKDQSRLRGDNAPLDLISIVDCQVSRGAKFIVVGAASDVATIRLTTTVVSIEEV